MFRGSHLSLIDLRQSQARVLSMTAHRPQGSNGGWPIDLTVLRSPPQWLSSAFATIIILLVIGMAALTTVAVIRLAIDLLSDDKQRASDAIRSFLPLAAAAIGLPLIVWRLVILSQQTRISEIKTQIDRETHYTSIFSRSIDQLGQTREISETLERNGVFQALSKTVPNIEVRLGGIHSLARLAEESMRDREKIENTLLSYVRENSWSNRDGARLKALPQVRLPAPDWNRSYCRGEVSQEVMRRYSDWKASNSEEAKKRLLWSVILPETRVDINEAIDAIQKISGTLPPNSTNRFYECLFVGRQFKSSLLGSSAFEHCTFVRCQFDFINVGIVQFLNSHLIECEFSGCGSDFEFYSCVLLNPTISYVDSTSMSFSYCDLFDISTLNVSDTVIKMQSTTCHRGFVSSDTKLGFMGKNSSLPEVSFPELTLSPDSVFELCAFPETDFTSTDLSMVKVTPPESLNRAEASHLTLHPTFYSRPSTWPGRNISHQ